MQLSIVLPVYNAKTFLQERVEFLADFLAKNPFDYEIILVDDCSTDGSRDLIERLEIPRLKKVFCERNLGKFGAIARGIALSQGDGCIFTDIDIPYDPQAIPALLKLVTFLGFHLVIGDRTLPESRYSSGEGKFRHFLNRAMSDFVRLYFTGGIFDSQCGLKAIRGDVARLLFPLLKETGFAGDLELIYIALKYNFAIRRFPVRMIYHGPSTVKPFSDAGKIFLGFFRIFARYSAGSYASEGLRERIRQDYLLE